MSLGNPKLLTVVKHLDLGQRVCPLKKFSKVVARVVICIKRKDS